MSDVTFEYERIRDAFTRPTLRLLNRDNAPVVMAVLAATFTREQPQIPREKYHGIVEAALDELRAHGAAVPAGTARQLCDQWVDSYRWLQRNPDDEHGEVYQLTSAANDALEYTARLTRERSMVSRSRIYSIVQATRRCAMAASTDKDAILAQLDEEIAGLQARRDEIAAMDEVQAASDYDVIEALAEVQSLMAQLPSDFIRVEEAMKRIQVDIITAFRQDDRPAGEVVADYLDRTANLMSDSAAGRAFMGATELLRDDRLLTQLRTDLATILSHSVAQTLNTAEQRDVADTAGVIERGIEKVNDQQQRVTRTLTAHIRRRDAFRDRELDDALRRVQAVLAEWYPTSRPRDRVPVATTLPAVAIGTLQTRFTDPRPEDPPLPLAGPEDPDDTLTADDLRALGGPQIAELARGLLKALANSQQVTAAEVFNAADVSMRRPTEILGYIHLAALTDSSDLETGSDREVVDAVRPDGTPVSYDIPKLSFDIDDSEPLSALIPEEEQP